MKVVEVEDILERKDMLPFIKHEEWGLLSMENWFARNPRKRNVVVVFGKHFANVVGDANQQPP